MRTIVVIACHFKSRDCLCDTTIARLEAAMRIATNEDTLLVTGYVPFEPGGPTLGELMSEWLLAHNASVRADRLRGGVGTFSEARLTCEAHPGERLVVVSSAWYLLQAKPIWTRRAEEYDVKISFHSVAGTGGWKTVFTYAVLAAITRSAIFLGCERRLESVLTRIQQSRVNGFRFDGCR